MKYKDFEQALGRLEQIVGELEKGELPLEQSMKLFEEGMELSRFCGTKLDEAERRVEVLLRGSEGDLDAQPFDPSEGEQE